MQFIQQLGQLLAGTNIFRQFSFQGVAINNSFHLYVMGQTNNRTPDFKKAREAVARIFSLVERVPVIDNLSEEGMRPQVTY